MKKHVQKGKLKGTGASDIVQQISGVEKAVSYTNWGNRKCDDVRILPEAHGMLDLHHRFPLL